MPQSAGRNRLYLFLAVAAASLLLAGCASGPGSENPQGATVALSLQQTKSPVQLLRNEVVSRIPPAAVDTVEGLDDASVPCKAEEADPKGLLRQWRSTSSATIVKSSQWRLDALTDDLIVTLIDQGWKARDAGTVGSVRRVLLTSATSPAEIQISAKQPDENRASTSTDEIVTDVRIEVETRGPCVSTDGSDSDEVKNLEGRS